MTKEEIIKRYEPYPNKAEVRVIGAMMDEYTKQQVVAFNKWLIMENKFVVNRSFLWFRSDVEQARFYELGNLYDAFISGKPFDEFEKEYADRLTNEFTKKFI